MIGYRSRTIQLIRRIGLSLMAGLLIGMAISEVSFIFLKDTARAPRIIELVIPAGTAAQISLGEIPPAIPDEMTFVVGDTLMVKNDDTSDHQLGPLWIPAGASASLTLDKEENYVFACSFQQDQFFGLDVREPVTIWTRAGGILFAGVPMGAIIALYSFVVYPMKKPEQAV